MVCCRGCLNAMNAQQHTQTAEDPVFCKCPMDVVGVVFFFFFSDFGISERVLWRGGQLMLLYVLYRKSHKLERKQMRTMAADECISIRIQLREK